MPEWKTTQFIYLDLFPPNRYAFRYPPVVFPRICAICGQPAETSVPLAAQKSKTLSTAYTISTRRDTFAVASMGFRIPLCNRHAGGISADEKDQESQGRVSMIMLGVSLFLGILAALLIFIFHYHNPLGAGVVLMSIFLGGLAGGLLLWPVLGVALPALVRLAQHRGPGNPFFAIKDYGLPQVTIQDDNNKVSMRLVFSFRNEQFFEQFKRLNNLEGHLLAAMDHPDYLVSHNALDALAQAGCIGAAPAILRKFMADIGKTPGICPDAARALEKLGIPRPLEMYTVDQLVAGLRFANTRDPVARVLVLCGSEYVLPQLQDPDPGVRIALLHALGKSRMAEAVPAILPLLRDPRKSGMERVFAAAARALKKIGTPEALAAVERWKKSP